MLENSAPFDAALKEDQKRCVAGLKASKLSRKNAAGDEAARLARQISHAAAMKKQFLKAVKSAIAMRP